MNSKFPSLSQVFRKIFIFINAILSLLWTQAQGAEDIVIGDFSGPGYGSWEATGTAFGTGPATGALLEQLGIGNTRGVGVATSRLNKSDAPVGSLTSPTFKIERPCFR